MEKGRINRREFLILTGTGLAGIALSACVPETGQVVTVPPIKPTEEQKIYDVPLPPTKATVIESQRLVNNDLRFENRPLMPNDKFQVLSKELINTGIGIFVKAGREMVDLWDRDTNPEELPDWVGDICPLVVTYDTNQTSLLYVEAKVAKDEAFKLKFPNNKEVIYREFDPLLFSLHIGSPEFSRQEGSIIECLYLLKEYLQFGIYLGAGKKIIDVMKTQGYNFIKPNGEELSDDEKFKFGTWCLHFQAVQNSQPNNMIWLLLDALPTLIIGSKMEDLIKTGKLPKTSRGIIPFYEAYKILGQSSSTSQKLRDFIDEWVRSGQIISPDRTFKLMNDQQIGAAAVSFQKFAGEMK